MATNQNNNPYLNAQMTWRDYVGSIVGSRNLMIIITLLSLCTSLVAVSGVVYIGSQSKLTPYIIEVDKLGRSQFMGTVPNTDIKDPRVINVLLNDFIADYRTVSIDKELTVKALKRLYAKLSNNSPANKKISEFYTANKEKNNPFVRADKETVAVEVKTILRVTSDTYMVEWNEYVRDPATGKLMRTEYYKANVTIEYKDTANFSFDALIDNPLGIFITDFSIQKL